MHACKDATFLCVYSGEALSTRLMAVRPVTVAMLCMLVPAVK